MADDTPADEPFDAATAAICSCIPQPALYDADGFRAWVRSLTGKVNPQCRIHGQNAKSKKTGGTS